MPQPIQTAQEAVNLAKRYGIQGKLPLQLDETVVPVVMLDAFGQGQYVGYAGAAYDSTTPVTGYNTYLVHPGTEDLEIIVDKVMALPLTAPSPAGALQIWSATVTTTSIGLATPLPTAPDWRTPPTHSRDQRGRPQGLLYTFDGPAPAGVFGPVAITGQVYEVDDLEIALRPMSGNVRSALIVSGGTVAYRLGLSWREVQTTRGT